jgi:hypothetical protein
MAGPINENLPHRFGGNAQEVAVIGIGPTADETKVLLLHQGGGVERVIRPFRSHLGRGQPAQLVLDQRQ